MAQSYEERLRRWGLVGCLGGLSWRSRSSSDCATGYTGSLSNSAGLKARSPPKT